MKTIFLFWLYNIYQRPYKYLPNPNARHLNELMENKLVTTHRFNRLRVTPKGKKVLLQNLAELSEDHSLQELLIGVKGNSNFTSSIDSHPLLEAI